MKMPERLGESPPRLPDKIAIESWWMLFVLLLLSILSFIDRFMITMLVDPIKRDLGLSDVQIGAILGPAFAIAYAVFAIPMGWAADRFSCRKVIFAGAAIWSLSASALGLVSSFGPFLLSRVGVGVGEASLTPAAYSLMGSKFPARRLTTVMSIYQAGAPLGTSVAFIIGGLVIGFVEAIGTVAGPFDMLLKPWQLALIVTGLPCVFVALLVFTFSEPASARRVSGEGTATESFPKFLWDNRALLAPIMIGSSLAMLLANSLMAWVPTYITREFGWAPPRFGPILGFITLVTAAAMVIKGWVVDWLFARDVKDAHLRFFTWLIVVATPISIGEFFLSNPILFLVCHAIVWALVGQCLLYVAATIQLIVPKHYRARMVALVLTLFSVIGAGLGPPLTGALTDYLFRDEARLGYSLALIAGVTLPIAWLLLRSVLPKIRAAVAAAAL